MDDQRRIWWLETSEFIIKVYLEYPEHLHNLHNYYPLDSEGVTIGNVEKLIPNLNNKTNYVVHYDNFKLYESLGLKIIKVHRGIKFEESDWLEEYINANTKLKIEVKRSGNDFEVIFFKVTNNFIFGKTLKTIRYRVDIRLISSDKVAQKLAAKPNYVRCTICDENLIAIHMRKTKLYFNTPNYVGMNILDLSKSLMCDFRFKKSMG